MSREGSLMQYLIACTCGHTVEAHDSIGCLQCGCRLTKEDAIDAAIDRERSRPWVPA